MNLKAKIWQCSKFLHFHHLPTYWTISYCFYIAKIVFILVFILSIDNKITAMCKIDLEISFNVSGCKIININFIFSVFLKHIKWRITLIFQ